MDALGSAVTQRADEDPIRVLRCGVGEELGERFGH